MTVKDMTGIERQGLDFALKAGQQVVVAEAVGRVTVEKPVYNWHAAAGVLVAVNDRHRRLLVWEEEKVIEMKGLHSQ